MGTFWDLLGIHRWDRVGHISETGHLLLLVTADSPFSGKPVRESNGRYGDAAILDLANRHNLEGRTALRLYERQPGRL